MDETKGADSSDDIGMMDAAQKRTSTCLPLPNITVELPEKKIEEISLKGGSGGGGIVIEPKVFSPYETLPNQAPRRILVERIKRQYASFDINETLTKDGSLSHILKSTVPI